VYGGKELIQHILSYNYVNELLSKFQTKETDLGRACADTIHSMFDFIIKNNEDYEEIEPEYSEYVYKEKEKLDLELEDFYSAFAKNIPLVLGFFEESEY
jgi:hypothetical protein